MNELNTKQKSSGADIITVCAFISLIFVAAIAFWILPDKTVSEQENRALSGFPVLTAKTLVDGEFTSGISDYYSDQFPLRDLFVGVKAASEIALQKGKNNGAILTGDGCVIAEATPDDFGTVDKNIRLINIISDNTDLPVTVAVAGRSSDVMYSHLPAMYPDGRSERLWRYFSDNMKGDFSFLDLRSPLSAKDAGGEYVYYRTDHHWTTLGAYYAYTELAAALGIEASSPDLFTKEKVSDSFYGTTWRSSGMKWVGPDDLYLWRFTGDESFTTEISDASGKVLRTINGFYDTDKLGTTDKYSVFLGGNYAVTRVFENSFGDKPILIVIKDSFSHSVAPFLARDFDLVMIDLRHYRADLTTIFDTEGASGILILMGASSLTDSTEALAGAVTLAK